MTHSSDDCAHEGDAHNIVGDMDDPDLRCAASVGNGIVFRVIELAQNV
jgi:hypothetical protein